MRLYIRIGVSLSQVLACYEVEIQYVNLSEAKYAQFLSASRLEC